MLYYCSDLRSLLRLEHGLTIPHARTNARPPTRPHAHTPTRARMHAGPHACTSKWRWPMADGRWPMADGRWQWVNFISGGCGGALSVCLNNPIDVVKSKVPLPLPLSGFAAPYVLVQAMRSTRLLDGHTLS